MSRAFTKEPDGNAPVDLPERLIGEERNIVTMRGFRLIEQEIDLSTRSLAKARLDEDTMEIAKALRDLDYWNARRETAELAVPENFDRVQFGVQVTIQGENTVRKTYCIVGLDEADPTKGLLSYVSPLARHLIGKKCGDFVETETGEFEVMEIKPC